MIDPIEVLFNPAGARIPNLGARALVDVTDGDTPNIRMPIRMLSVDTPEVTAKSSQTAAKRDKQFVQLAKWIVGGKAPVTRAFADYILPKLQSGTGGTLQFDQGKKASDWFKMRTEVRLKKPNGRRRNLFIATSEEPFDKNHRLLAYIAPSYTAKERVKMTREERATFNLDLVESGWAAPFIIFPNVPGELDMPLFLEKAIGARNARRGQFADPLSLSGYEYRMCEKLYGITKKIVAGGSLSYPERLAWRSRYAADMRNRMLHGPESYMPIEEPYRIWIWPDDVQMAIGMLNLVPAPELTT